MIARRIAERCDQRGRHYKGADGEEPPGGDLDLFPPQRHQPEDRRKRSGHGEIGPEIDADQHGADDPRGQVIAGWNGAGHQADGQIIGDVVVSSPASAAATPYPTRGIQKRSR